MIEPDENGIFTYKILRDKSDPESKERQLMINEKVYHTIHEDVAHLIATIAQERDYYKNLSNNLNRN